MPATNRDGALRLTPAPSSTSRDYLRSQPPSWAAQVLAPLQTALALFAVVVIVRSLARRAYHSWFSASSDSDRLRPSLRATHPQPQPYAHSLWAMGDEKPQPQPQPRSAGTRGGIKGQHHVSFDENAQGEFDTAAGRNTPLAIDPNWKRVVAPDTVPKPFMSRPPPAPPLTPPELSTAVFTFDDRPRSQESFIHQPNPDYTTSSSSATTSTSTSQSSSASPATPRRRSYNRTLPIGIPMPATHKQPDPADLTLSPSSYPPTSPILPPAPPEMLHQNAEEGSREIGVHGEIISVLDGEGAGWSRHTRVYGGGVCLACAASGGDHGGFYGATVRPEEMR